MAPVSGSSDSRNNKSDIGSSTQSGSSSSSAGESAGASVSRLTTELRDRASRMADDAGDLSKEYLDDAGVWLQANYGKALTVVGVLAAAGLFGYFLASKSRRFDRT